MEFSCRLYYNTGFDAVNVPDSPATLAAAADSYADFGPFDIHQADFQPVIKIRCPNGEDDVIGADYLKLSAHIQRNGMSYDRNSYYSIQSYNMTSPDVAVLNVIQDSFLTAGGTDGIIILAGVTERHHVASDKFGEWTDDDPMLVPSHPLKLVHNGHSAVGNHYSFATRQNDAQQMTCCDGDEGIFFDYDHNSPGFNGDSTMNIIMCTVNLAAIGYSNDAQNIGEITGMIKSYLTGDDPTQGDPTYVSLPVADLYGFNLFRGSVHMGNCSMAGRDSTGQINTRQALLAFPVDTDTQGSSSRYWGGGFMKCGAFFANDNDAQHPNVVKNALKALRAVGAEGSLLYSYAVPYPLLDADPYGGTENPKGFREAILSGTVVIASTDGCVKSAGYATYLEGGDAYNFCYNLGVSNKRVLYGKYNKYVMVACATGSKIEANPEDLIYSPFEAPPSGTQPSDTSYYRISEGSDVGMQKAPYICCFSDPRPTGRPYFNFLFRRANPGIGNVLNGAIAGEMWRQVPIVFSEFSGALQADTKYKINKATKDYEASREYNLEQNLSALDDQYIKDAANRASNTVHGSIIGTPLRALKNTIGYAQDAAATAINQIAETQLAESSGGTYAFRERDRARVAAAEEALYGIERSYAEPSIEFIPSETSREATGNGVFYARYMLDGADIDKFDRLLTQFGYRITESLESSMMTNRTNFNYIKAHGVKVDNDPEKAIALLGGRGRASKALLEDVSAMFDNGIRIWHTKPDFLKMQYDNPIRPIT